MSQLAPCPRATDLRPVAAAATGAAGRLSRSYVVVIDSIDSVCNFSSELWVEVYNDSNT